MISVNKVKVNRAEVKRRITSDAVCREVRYQMSAHGGIKDNDILFNLLRKWMKVAKKSKYIRPKYNEPRKDKKII